MSDHFCVLCHGTEQKIECELNHLLSKRGGGGGGGGGEVEEEDIFVEEVLSELRPHFRHCGVELWAVFG